MKPNQKRIEIQIDYSIYKESIQKAMKNLNGAAAKVFMYLMIQENESMVFFHPDTIAKDYGISAESVRRCIPALIENNYLRKINGDKISYIFSNRGKEN